MTKWLFDYFCRHSVENNNCRRGKFQRRVLSERSEFTRLYTEPCRLLVNGACGQFCETFSAKSFPVRRTFIYTYKEKEMYIIIRNMVLSCADKKVPQRNSRPELHSLIKCNRFTTKQVNSCFALKQHLLCCYETEH